MLCYSTVVVVAMLLRLYFMLWTGLCSLYRGLRRRRFSISFHGCIRFFMTSRGFAQRARVPVKGMEGREMRWALWVLEVVYKEMKNPSVFAMVWDDEYNSIPIAFGHFLSLSLSSVSLSLSSTDPQSSILYWCDYHATCYPPPFSNPSITQATSSHLLILIPAAHLLRAAMLLSQQLVPYLPLLCLTT